MKEKFNNDIEIMKKLNSRNEKFKKSNKKFT
jgi:hypothetical protein